jgi:flagellar protein FliS
VSKAKQIKKYADSFRMKDLYTDKKGSNMYGNTAHSIYAQNNVGIESPEKLISMLYEGILRFNAQAKKAIKDGDVEKRVYWINRSIAVIVELINTLDMKQGQIAQYLGSLYDYEIQLLGIASAEQNIDKVDEVNNVFRELNAAWKETTNVAQ